MVGLFKTIKFIIICNPANLIFVQTIKSETAPLTKLKITIVCHCIKVTNNNIQTKKKTMKSKFDKSWLISAKNMF